MDAEITGMARQLAAAIAAIPDIEGQLDTLNEVRSILHEISPMRNEPVDLVLWAKCEDISANDYNPNTVAPPEMRLLERSIRADGYTQPIVTWHDNGSTIVVDGFHRHRVGRERADIRERMHARLPITRIRTAQSDRADRIAATIRHNRARGEHAVEAMSTIVAELYASGWTPAQIGAELGMEADEVLRLRQITGIAALFADREYSEAWEP